MDTILKLVLDVFIAGGGGAVIAFGIFKLLGEKWIDSKFQKDLDEYRMKVNALFNRITKIHEKEIEILPEIWQKLQKYYGKVYNVMPILQSHPDLTVLENNKIEEYLLKRHFSNTDIASVLQASDRNKCFRDKLFWYDLSDAQSELQEFRNYLILNRIFLCKEIYDVVRDLDSKLGNALIKMELGNTPSRDREMISEAMDIIHSETTPIINKIETLIQNRLHLIDAV
jgi:hypothetical protein